MSNFQKNNNELWIEKYKRAKQYYDENGNLLISSTYETNDGVKIGMWISIQRREYKNNNLPKRKIELLEEIGMVWSVYDAKWFEYYELAAKYYAETGNLLIPRLYTTNSGIKLGSWIVTQRKNYSQGILTNKQISLLNDIGMEWVYTNNPDYVWEKNYNTVLDFYSKYEHLYIPIGYVTEDGVRLGVWLYDRKLEYQRNELSEERKRKLEKLDKTWLEPINTKSSFPEQAVLYYIRKSFPSAAKLSTKEISEIDIYISELKVGIEYDGPSHKNRVSDDIKKSQICKKMGIELIRIRDSEIPIINDDSYRIILKDDTFDALDNGIKELFHHLKITDTDINAKRDYIEIADNYIKSIDLDWYSMYEKLKEYNEKYGNINVPIHYKTSDGTQLGH